MVKKNKLTQLIIRCLQKFFFKYFYKNSAKQKMPYLIIYVPFLKVAGMALFPFILVNKPHYRYDAILINHEKIHLAQQLEMFILPFYIFYLSNYLINLLIYEGHHEAYLNICFEREAYQCEHDLNYLKKRRPWACLKFL